MSLLFRFALRAGGEPLRETQRRWLSEALSCQTAGCLRQRYDERNSILLESGGARPLVGRFRVRRRDVDGLLVVMLGAGWLTYTARETVTGRGSGDVYAASIGGTARYDGATAREIKPSGCQVSLRHDGHRGWSMRTNRCFDGAIADLNERFEPSQR